MATLASLTTLVDNALYGAMPWLAPMEDTLVTSGVIAGTTEIEFTEQASWKKGHYFEFTSDGDMGRFVDDGVAATAVTVRRGVRGTTAASHSVGDVVRRNPVFEKNRIEHWINFVIDNMLWQGDTPVWSWAHGSFSFSDTDHTVSLDAADDEVARVYQIRSDTGDTQDIVELPRGSSQGGYWDVVSRTDTAVAANRRALVVRKVWDSTKTVYYTIKQAPRSSDIASISDKVAALVPYEAASRCLWERAGVADRHRPEGSPSALAIADRWSRRFQAEKRDLHNLRRREVPTESAFTPRIGRSRLVTGSWGR